MRARYGAALAALLALATACGGGTQHPRQAQPTAGTATSAKATAERSALAAPKTATVTPTRQPVAPTKVLVIVEENHPASAAMAGMPYLAGLAARYARVDGYRAVASPSLPNYLALAGGSTFGVHDDASPSAHPIQGSSVFGQALALGKTAKVYAEGMDRPCQTGSAGRYAVRHTGWPYFADERAACRRFDVPMGSAESGALAADAAAGTLPSIGWAIPDLCNDAHDCSLGTADRWLRTWVPVLTSGPDFTSGRLAIAITFDEGAGGDERVPLVVLHRDLDQVIVAGTFDHYSLLRFCDDVLGAAPLRRAAAANRLGLFPKA